MFEDSLNDSKDVLLAKYVRYVTVFCNDAEYNFRQ